MRLGSVRDHNELDHRCRVVGGILALMISHKSLYDQQYGVFARDKSDTTRAQARWEVMLCEGSKLCFGPFW